jgi:hypothetical protein
MLLASARVAATHAVASAGTLIDDVNEGDEAQPGVV